MSRIRVMNEDIQRKIIEFYRQLYRHDRRGNPIINTKFYNRLPSYSKEQIYNLICLEGIAPKNLRYLRETIIQDGRGNILDIPLPVGDRQKYIQIINVRGDGNCGIYAFILGLARLDPDLFNRLMDDARRNRKLLHQYLRELTINYSLSNETIPLFEWNPLPGSLEEENRIILDGRRINQTEELKTNISEGRLSEYQLKKKYPNLQQANTKVNRDYTSDAFLGKLRETVRLRNNINLFRYNGRGIASNNICNSINLLQVPIHWQLIFVTDKALTITNRQQNIPTSIVSTHIAPNLRSENTSTDPTGQIPGMSHKQIQEQINAFKQIERQRQRNRNLSLRGTVNRNGKKVTKEQRKILTNFLNNKLTNHKGPDWINPKKKKYTTLRNKIYRLKKQKDLMKFIAEVNTLVGQSKSQERKIQWEKAKRNLQGGSQFINIRGKGKRKIRYSKTGKKYVILGGKKNYKIFR